MSGSHAASSPEIDVQLMRQPVSYAAPTSFHAGSGGECVFLGRTRLEEHPKHRQLLRLSYEAHEQMAAVVLRDLARQAAERFGCDLVRIHHALGEVAPGEASVLVQVACGHRAESFEACRFLIDQLKAKAPIWKREDWADGTTWAQGTPIAGESRP